MMDINGLFILTKLEDRNIIAETAVHPLDPHVPYETISLAQITAEHLDDCAAPEDARGWWAVCSCHTDDGGLRLFNGEYYAPDDLQLAYKAYLSLLHDRARVPAKLTSDWNRMKLMEHDARTTMKYRGHRLVYVTHTNKAHGGLYRILRCHNCGMEAQIYTDPLPNEVTIGGEAIATNCTEDE